jgi:hypothetical protein
MDHHDGVLVVVRPGELELEIELLQVSGEAGQEPVEVRVGFALGEELAPGLQLLGVGAQLVQGFEALFQGAALLQDGSALGRVVPEPGVLDLMVELGQLSFEVGLLKDTPGCW